MVRTLSSREFNQDTGRAKRIALEGPVCITDRGRPTHVLLTYDDYCSLADAEPSIVDLVGSSDAGGIALEITRSNDLARPASFD